LSFLTSFHCSLSFPRLQALVYGCLPACLLKQVVNVIQMVSAADAMAEMDAKEA
jgi:hypothetical protein